MPGFSQTAGHDQTDDRKYLPGLALLRAFAPALLVGLAWSQVAAAEGLPPIKLTFRDGSSLTFAGNINKGVLSYDDGIDTNSYSIIDNGNLPTSFGLTYQKALGDWTFSGILDFNYAPFSTFTANILDPSTPADAFSTSDDDWNQIEVVFENKTYGTISLGQGLMATGVAAEVDLSGTTVVSYSEIMDTAGGQLFRFTDPSLGFPENVSSVSVDDAFANYDYDQFVRLRYDTPTYSGFGASFAFGRDLLDATGETRDDNVADFAINYSGGNTDWQYQAAAGYLYDQGGADDTVASGSILHNPSGLSLTVAAGSSDGDLGTGTYTYGKLGISRSLVKWGTTAASVDYYSGQDINLTDTITDSDSSTWSVALVQNIDSVNLSLYATYRVYEYSDNTAEYHDGSAILAGFNFTF